MSPEQIRSLIRQHNLTAYEDAILEASKPAIQLQLTRADKDSDIPLGVSKVGGSPDVPFGFEWVRNSKGDPMTFLAQIRLRDLTAFDAAQPLPNDGMLYFFCDVIEFDNLHQHHVSYIRFEEMPDQRRFLIDDEKFIEDEVASSLWRKPHPISEVFVPRWSFPGLIAPLKSCSVNYRETPTFPRSWLIDGLGTDEKMYNRYWELLGERFNYHQVFGHPAEIHKYMEYDLQRIRLGLSTVHSNERDNIYKMGKQNWLLLFQISSCQGKIGHGEMWGDGGKFYFWIHKADLAERNFQNTYCFFQCH